MKVKYHLYCLITICIFSTLEFASKKLSSGVSPFTVTAWRFLFGGMVLLPFALRQMKVNLIVLHGTGVVVMAGLGILNVCLSMLILQLAIYYGKASLAAVLVSANPLFVSIFAHFIVKEKLSLPQIIGLSLGIAGLVVIILGENQLQTSDYRNLSLGILLALVAAMNFGLYTVLTKKTIFRYGNMLTNSISFICGASVLFVVGAILDHPVFFKPGLKDMLIILYLGLFITGIAYILYFEGMRGLTAGKASQYFFLKPVIATILAYAFLSESLTSMQIAGIVLIIISLSYGTLGNVFNLRKGIHK